MPDQVRHDGFWTFYEAINLDGLAKTKNNFFTKVLSFKYLLHRALQSGGLPGQIESGYHFDVIGEHESKLLTHGGFVFPGIFYQACPVYTRRM